MKTKCNHFLYIFCIFFFVSNSLSATHLTGGEITWECHPTNGQYRITGRLYRDCNFTAAFLPTTLNISNNAVGSSSILCNLISLYQVSPSCFDPLSSNLCGGTNGIAVEVGVYKSAWITLPAIPATGLKLSWGSCCRPTAITNIASSSTGFGLRAFMYPSGGGSSCNNDSPNFLEDPLVIACSGVSNTYNNMAADANNDSLYVKLASAIDDLGANAVYTTGYSPSNPFPDAAKNSNNVPLTLNPVTGAISFESHTTGWFIGVYEIEEWRQGALIGRVFRDVPTVITNCTIPYGLCPQSSNAAPSLNMETDSVLYPNGPFVKPVFAGGLTDQF